jgi:hypothetical protein
LTELAHWITVRRLIISTISTTQTMLSIYAETATLFTKALTNFPHERYGDV